MSYNTVDQIVKKFGLQNCIEPGFTGKKLKYEEISNTSNLKVSKLYQRLISKSALKKYKKLDQTLLIPAVVARRPESLGANAGDWLIDGQHKSVMHFLSQSEESGVSMPAMVYEHNEESSLEECEAIESKIFHSLNTQRKKLSKIDEIRSGVVFNDPVSKWVETVMKTLNLTSDGFGSEEVDAVELRSFNQFFIMVTSDYHDSLDKIRAGYDLWKKMFRNHIRQVDYVTGPMLRALCLVSEFVDEVLENGRKEEFLKYLIYHLPSLENQTTLCKGFIDANAPRYIFWNILDKYKIYCSNNNIKSNGIGDETYKIAVKINKRFERPANA